MTATAPASDRTQNARKHGIFSELRVIPGLETDAEWEEHRDGVLESLAPAGPLEASLAERLAWLLWRLRRLARHENEGVFHSLERVEEDVEAEREDARLEALETEAPWTRFNTIPQIRRIEGLFARFRDNYRSFNRDEAQTLFARCFQTVRPEPEPGKEDEPPWSVPEIDWGYEPSSPDYLWKKLQPALDTRGWTRAQLLAAVAARFAELRELIKQGEAEEDARKTGHLRGQRLIPDQAGVALVQRYEAHLSRDFARTLKHLHELQDRRLRLPGASSRKAPQGAPLPAAGLQSEVSAPTSPEPPAPPFPTRVADQPPSPNATACPERSEGDRAVAEPRGSGAVKERAAECPRHAPAVPTPPVSGVSSRPSFPKAPVVRPPTVR